MKISLHNFLPIASALLLASVFGNSASAQTSAQDALYEANSQRPLGGFFAKGFTRTFTLLGGWNFGAADLDASSQELSDTGFAVSGAMGRRHSKTLRSEIEIAVRDNELSSDIPGSVASNLLANVQATSLMKNVIFDFPNDTRFTPYAGAGIGVSWFAIDATTTVFGDTTTTSEFSESETALAYQAIGGIATRVNPSTDFVVEYRFLGTGDIDTSTLGDSSYRANNLFLGLKLEY